MSFADTMNILSNINCFLSSGVSFLEQKKQGVDTTTATCSLFNNIGNGVVRNAIAHDMAEMGNPMGINTNLAYGYGNPVANTCGTMALLSVATPWMFFNSPFCGGGMYSIGMPYGGGMYAMGMGMPYGGIYGCGFNSGFGYGISPGFFC